MKPYTHHFKPFTIDRIPGIRLNRELGLQEARDSLIKKKTKRTSSGTKSPRKSKKKLVMTPKARAAYDAASPEVQAMFKDYL